MFIVQTNSSVETVCMLQFVFQPRAGSDIVLVAMVKLKVRQRKQFSFVESIRFRAFLTW